jgi:hypothetical protein
MRYSYVAAWSVIGGISLANESQPFELYRSDHCRFVLTRDPDSLLATIDRGRAIVHLMLNGLVGQRGTADFKAALDAEVEKIKAERAQKAGAQAVLVVEAGGEVETSLHEPSHEHEDFIVTFHAVDKQAVIGAHRPDVDAMKLALAFESEIPSHFDTLAEGVYLTTPEGKTVHSITVSQSVTVSVSAGLTTDAASRISARFRTIQRADDIDQVQRLFSQMVDSRTDRLKAFLSGWAALEILIAKSFKIYEEVFLSPLANAGQPTLRERFLQRLKGVMKDKYRLTDKFLAVAAVLFPDLPDTTVQDDYKKFSRLKELRDAIFHGEEFPERDLPVHELAALLRKYLLAHVATPNLALNTDAR